MPEAELTETDEVAELIASANTQAVAQDDDDEGEPEETSSSKKTTKRRRKSTRKNGNPEAGLGQAKTLDELEVDQLIPKEHPQPTENVKTLGDMYAKFGVGDSPEFNIQVWRTFPKMAPGGRKFDGFYDTWDTPLSYEQIQSEYGGGQYRIAVMGPHPSRPNQRKHYDSLSISISGEPVWDRVPRALAGKEKKPDAAGATAGFSMPSVPSQESPKLAEAALKMMQSTAESERDERRRIEDKSEARRARDYESFTPVVEAERRRADELVAAERSRSETERRYMQERLEEERHDREELKKRMEHFESSRPSVGAEIAALAQAGLFQRDDGGTAKEMLTQVLEKHRAETDQLVMRHTQFIDSMRQGHQAELQAIRDAHRRELEAERESSRSREQRMEERYNSEREERRRDQDRFSTQLKERDQQWTDRMEQAKENVRSSWEARHQSTIASYENKEQWLRQEIDRLTRELTEAKLKQQESGDIFTQLSKYRELQTVMKEFNPDAAAAASSSSSGGIGLSKDTPQWLETLLESPLADKIGERLFGGGSAPGSGVTQPAPAQYQLGQVVPTPNGEMVVVQAPNGELALAPKEALEKHHRALQAQQGGTLLGANAPAMKQPGRRNQVMPDPRRYTQKKKTVSAVPNLAEGLPRPRPPWDGGGSDDEGDRSAAESNEPLELSAQERKGLTVMAHHIHESVMQADEPEEFVHKMMNKYDANVLRTIVSRYTTAQLARGIQQVEPRAAGATPAGQQFVGQASKLLRDALEI